MMTFDLVDVKLDISKSDILSNDIDPLMSISNAWLGPVWASS